MTFILVLAALILVLYTGMPMFAGMFLFSVIGLLVVEGDIASLGEVVFGNINAYLLVAIPLFMLMGDFLAKCGAARDLYALGNRASKWLPGRLAAATIVANALFGFVTGMSIAAAAFSLGISNMRRRKARTLLTLITLVLLTFIVLSFTSVVTGIRYNIVEAPGTPRYDGVMLRTALWEPLEESSYRLLNDEFGQTRAVAPRAWFFGAQLGEQTFLTIARGDKKDDKKDNKKKNEGSTPLLRNP